MPGLLINSQCMDVNLRGGTATCLVALALLAAGIAAAPAQAKSQWLVGAMHEHSAYSDGWPGSRPYDYYVAGRSNGLDFMGGSDHSDNLGIPASFSGYCFDPSYLLTTPPPAGCAIADTTNPRDSFRKWDATAEQAAAASTESFAAFRGFEWTSDRFGHINVYFSSDWLNAKLHGGYLITMSSFYRWFTAPVKSGGGADGIAVFNHPGDKKLSTKDPGFNWNDFEYVPAADERMVGIETFNQGSDYASPDVHDGPPEGWYAHALDRGWHLGAVGAEDLGHDFDDDWGGPGEAKTVVLSEDRSPEAIKEAMLARHFYAVIGPQWRLSFRVAGAQMGSRLHFSEGLRLPIRAALTRVDGEPLGGEPELQLITSGGREIASSADPELTVKHPASADERWYFIRASVGGKVVAYSTPVWIEPR